MFCYFKENQGETTNISVAKSLLLKTLQRETADLKTSGDFLGLHHRSHSCFPLILLKCQKSPEVGCFPSKFVGYNRFKKFPHPRRRAWGRFCTSGDIRCFQKNRTIEPIRKLLHIKLCLVYLILKSSLLEFLL